MIETVDHSAGVKGQASVPDALPSTPRPSYKPELQAKVKDLAVAKAKRTRCFIARAQIPAISHPPGAASNEMISCMKMCPAILTACFTRMAARTAPTRILPTMAIPSATGKETLWWWTSPIS